MIAMRDHLRALRLLIGTGLTVAPGRMATALLETLGRSITALNALWAGLLVSAAIDRDSSRAVLAIVALALTGALTWILRLVGAEARVTMAERVSFALDRRIAALTGSIPTLSHHENPEFADQVQILRQNRGILGGGLSSMMYNLDYLLTVAVTLLMAAAIDVRLLLVALTAIPPLLGARLRYRWAQQAEAESALPGRQALGFRQACTSPDVGLEIRVFGLQHEIIKRLTSALSDGRRPLAHASRKAAGLRLVEDLFFAVILTLVLAWLVVTAEGDTAARIAVAIVAARQIQVVIVEAVHGFSGAGGFADTLRTLHRVLWLERYAADEKASTGGTLPAPSRLTRSIQLQNVSFTYGQASRPVLQGVTVQLPAGAVVGIVGENGAGKTTLVKVLAGMYRPTDGAIHVDHADMAAIDLDDWRARLTAVFQDHARLELTAQHSIGVGDHNLSDDTDCVLAAADRAGAGPLITSLPDQLQTQLGAQWENGTNLSGGQWQQIALARGMMRTHPLVQFLDEPTAALDAEAEHRLFQRYAHASRANVDQGTITLLVTHRFTTVREADLILVLHDGQLIEQGTHEQLLRASGHYAELYDLQASGYQHG